MIGKRARDIIPGHEEYWFDRYARIAETREAERFEAPAKALDRYYEVFAFPMQSNDAPDRTVAALFRDASDRKKAEEQRELLTRELSHRVKNTLAVVQALARQSGTEGLTVEQGCGAEVLGPVPTIEQALEFLSRQRPDAATLDMNLHGTPSLPIANELADLEIPFVVISGYSNCYAESAAFRNARFLKKPYKERELLEAFAELL